MAKVHVEKLLNKYNIKADELSGGNYQKVVSEILRQNNENITKKMLKFSNDKLVKVKDIITLPDLTSVLPKRAIQVAKTATKGKLIIETLRNDLTKKLRSILEKPEYVYRRGKLKGTIKDQAIKDFQNEITNSFSGYTKRKRGEMPVNIQTIATTEIKNTVNNIKDEYVGQLRKDNPDLQNFKTWLHLGRSKNPREHHKEMNDVTIPYEQDFVLFNKITKKVIKTPYPHHFSMGAGEVINCECEAVYSFEINKKDYPEITGD